MNQSVDLLPLTHGDLVLARVAFEEGADVGWKPRACLVLDVNSSVFSGSSILVAGGTSQPWPGRSVPPWVFSIGWTPEIGSVFADSGLHKPTHFDLGRLIRIHDTESIRRIGRLHASLWKRFEFAATASFKRHPKVRDA